MIGMRARASSSAYSAGHICLDAIAEQADRGFTRCGYEADTRRISPTPLLTPWFADTARGTLQQRQTALDRVNQNLYAVLYLVKEKAGTILEECIARIQRARDRWRRVESNHQVWKKSKGHHQVVVLASQYHITLRPRSFQTGSVAPAGEQAVSAGLLGAHSLFPGTTIGRPSTSTTTSTGSFSSKAY